MAFTASRDQSGVYRIRVEGQLIVGNRQELKTAVRLGQAGGGVPLAATEQLIAQLEQRVTSP